ncbi:MAG: hypothetical protein AB1489_12695 [Acidobacteriota bacterium]
MKNFTLTFSLFLALTGSGLGESNIPSWEQVLNPISSPSIKIVRQGKAEFCPLVQLPSEVQQNEIVDLVSYPTE